MGRSDVSRISFGGVRVSLVVMAKPVKRKVPGSGGRVTPKGGVSTTSRTTAPMQHKAIESPKWVPILMFTLFAVGAVTIVSNYLGVLPGGANTWYLVGGLGLILGGIVTATQYR